MFLRATLIALATLTATSVSADFARVDDRDHFMKLVEGRDLTRLGIKLNVDSSHISGKAFGTSVKGAWQWNNGYFCRSLYFGSRNLGDNCQEVKIDDATIRFTSDQGTGDFADFTLR